MPPKALLTNLIYKLVIFFKKKFYSKVLDASFCLSPKVNFVRATSLEDQHLTSDKQQTLKCNTRNNQVSKFKMNTI